MATDIEDSEKSNLQWVPSARAKLDRFVAARLAPPPYLRWADARLAVLGGLHACEEKTRPTTPNLGFGRASNGASCAAHAAKASASRHAHSGRKRNTHSTAPPLSLREPRPAGCVRMCSCQCSAARDTGGCRIPRPVYHEGYGVANCQTKMFTMPPLGLSSHKKKSNLNRGSAKNRVSPEKKSAPRQIEMSW